MPSFVSTLKTAAMGTLLAAAKGAGAARPLDVRNELTPAAGHAPMVSDHVQHPASQLEKPPSRSLQEYFGEHEIPSCASKVYFHNYDTGNSWTRPYQEAYPNRRCGDYNLPKCGTEIVTNNGLRTTYHDEFPNADCRRERDLNCNIRNGVGDDGLRYDRDFGKKH